MATRRNEYTFRGGDIIEREEYHDGKYGAKGKKREKKKTPTREDMKKVNAMNKAKKARHKMLTYFGPGDILATWGYLVKNRPGSMKEALDDFKKAIRTVRREYKKRGYELFWIRNIEKGTRGAWHIHIIVNEIGDTASILEKAWQKGGTWACAIKKSQYYDEDFTELGNYITKDENTQKEKEDGTEKLERLKQSIKLLGILQPLLIENRDGKDYVIAGHCRRKCCIDLLNEGNDRFSRVPCVYKTSSELEQDAGQEDDIVRQIMIIQANCYRDKSDWEKMTETLKMENLVKELREKAPMEGKTRDILKDLIGTSSGQLGRYHAISTNLCEQLMSEFEEDRIKISVAYEISKLNKEYQKRKETGKMGNGVLPE